jgi:predicted house-cleaning noncanonical NTP pyrophosphatase (MazG superfamily)
MIVYDKLVRDKIIDTIDEECNYRILKDDGEYEIALRNKLSEEVEELFSSPSEEEMADVLEVVEAILNYFKLDPYSVESARQFKAARAGAFKDRVFLKSVGSLSK